MTLDNTEHGHEDTTELKLVTLISIHPELDQALLLELLISAEGSVPQVLANLETGDWKENTRKRPSASIGYQTSLSAFRRSASSGSPSKKQKLLTKKGETLHLYSPEDVASNTPCSIVHNFLPPKEADELLEELLEEAPTYERQTFKLFDNVVQSPHSACFYVESLEEEKRQRTEYLYNGSYLTVCDINFSYTRQISLNKA